MDLTAPLHRPPANVRRTLTALAAVQAALAQLRSVNDAADMIRHGPAAACDTLGFARAALYRVSGDELVLEHAHARHPPEQTQQLSPKELLRLSDLPLESEMIRRRDPLLQARALPQEGAAVRSADVGAYASAPVLTEGRVTGFLHADHFGTSDYIDEVDQLTLCAFAEGFGLAFERTVLRERLNVQLDRTQKAIRSTDQLLNELVATGLEVGSVERRSQARLTGEPEIQPDPRDRVHTSDATLTPREIEVIELISAGETNAHIAQQLLISEPTVKSHVRHILRKLGATHRAEAVARYLAIGS